MALQLVGMRMSGQLQDARNVAMSIIGPALPGLDATQPSIDIGPMLNQMQTDSTGSSSSSAAPDFQHLVINLLKTALHKSTLGGTSLPGITTPNATGQTLLHLASMSSYDDLARELIGWGADVDRRDANGWTALHFATAFGHAATMQLLGGAGGADLLVVDGWGRTAWDIAPDDLRDCLDDIRARQRQCRASSFKDGGDVESGGEGDDEAWSEDGSIHEDHPHHQAQQPLAVPSRAISRAASQVSIAPVSPIVDSPPPSPTITAAGPRPWHQRYNPLPPMPWAGMQLRGFNPIPNLGFPFPDVPFPFVRPFAAKEKGEGAGMGEGEGEGEREKGEEAQEAQEQSMAMMTWWGVYLRASWEKFALQQQQQQAELADPEGPPPYSASPPETATAVLTTSTSTAAPADPPTAEPAPSGSPTANAPAHTYPPPQPPQPPQPPGRPHRRVDYGPAAAGVIPEYEIYKYGYRSLVRRAKSKKKDKMLIFFWIPVLFGTFTFSCSLRSQRLTRVFFVCRVLQSCSPGRCTSCSPSSPSSSTDSCGRTSRPPGPQSRTAGGGESTTECGVRYTVV
jgi:hypothetical protein